MMPFPLRILSGKFAVFICVALLICSFSPGICTAQTTSTVTQTTISAPPATQPIDYASNAAQYRAQPITTSTAIRASLILFLFILIAAAIALRKLPAMLALPLMALGIGVIAGVPFRGENGVLQAILEGKTSPTPSGSFQLYKAIIWVLFGGIFARFISDSKIAERIVKYAAEYGGENPFNVALLMAAITILIFTAANGLPMIIMLGTVMFPILLSLGVPAVVCGCLLLLAFPIGSCLNPAEWARISEVFSVGLPKVKTFFLTWAGVQTIVLIAFLAIEFMRMKRINLSRRSITLSVARFFAIAGVLIFIIFLERLESVSPRQLKPALLLLGNIKTYTTTALQWAVWMLLLAGIVISQLSFRRRGNQSQTLWPLLTPILPLLFLLLLGFNNAFIPAFMASLTYGVLTTPQPQALQKLGRSVINGVADVAAPVILMIGIGMLIAAATHPQVEAVLTPVLARVIPITRPSYVIFFLLASPLALYRGPLNSYGLGVGVARLMQNFMPPAATMGALQSVSMLQDPTTTQNVWICGFLKLDINALLFKLFFYSLALVIIGLLLSVALFFPGY